MLLILAVACGDSDSGAGGSSPANNTSTATSQGGGGASQGGGGANQGGGGASQGGGGASQGGGGTSQGGGGMSQGGGGAGGAMPPGRIAEQVVGSSGGTVEAEGGVSIEIPAGALPSDVTITIDEVSDAPVPEGATSLGLTIQLGPEGQTFAAPVKVKLPWSGPDNVPVELAHAPQGGGTWTTLTENADFDATHVWAETSSFSWFQPVVYQGAPDSPIVLDNQNPTGGQKLVARSSTPMLSLHGAGFRGDTVVKLFKDGVTTTTLSSVQLQPWGLQFQIPAAFTATLGLITIEAKNPAATASAAAAVHVVETPVLQSLSPSTVNVTERDDNNYSGINVPISVTATDLPDDLSLCEVWIAQSFGEAGVLVADTTAPSETAAGFAVVATNWHHVTGTSQLELSCSGVSANKLSITFNLVPKE